MLISCPMCPKVYRVAASSIPPEGRDVKCSSCGSVWFESGMEAEVLTPTLGEETDERYLLGLDVELASKIVDAVYADAPEEEDQTDLAALAMPNEAPTIKMLPPADVTSESLWDFPTQPDVEIDPWRTKAAEPKNEPVSHQFTVANAFGFIRDAFSKILNRHEAETNTTPGSEAAAAFRAQVRAKERNRMTPLKAFGWLTWGGSIACLALVAVTQRSHVQTFWPRTANIYALFEDTPEPSVLIENVSSRFAESLQGPVVELRGVLINNSKAPIVPQLLLSAHTVDGTEETQPFLVSPVEIPGRGERPFVIRAKVPVGTKTARLSFPLVPLEKKPERQLVLQQSGSGWDQASPPPQSQIR